MRYHFRYIRKAIFKKTVTIFGKDVEKLNPHTLLKRCIDTLENRLAVP